MASLINTIVSNQPKWKWKSQTTLDKNAVNIFFLIYFFFLFKFPLTELLKKLHITEYGCIILNTVR